MRNNYATEEEDYYLKAEEERLQDRLKEKQPKSTLNTCQVIVQGQNLTGAFLIISYKMTVLKDKEFAYSKITREVRRQIFQTHYYIGLRHTLLTF